MNKCLTAVAMSLAAALAGCATERQTETAVGTGVGAATGAVIGSAVGGRKATAVGAAVGGAAGAAVGYNWDMVKQKLGMASKGSGVEVTEQGDGALKLNVPGSISFATGSSTIQPGLYPTLDKIAATLQEYPASSITIVGHTDNVGDAQSNMDLSARRASAVADYLAQRGVDRSRMSVQPRGETAPIADNATEAGRAQNRRVEMVVRPTADAKVGAVR
jgi:outer membrane protein OmpA-like peptidoglycan-associated protein